MSEGFQLALVHRKPNLAIQYKKILFKLYERMLIAIPAQTYYS